MATGTRLLSMTVTLPFVLWKFDAATAAVWLVFASIASLRALADFGFTSTFVRLTSFARSGVPIEGLAPGALESSEKKLENSREVISAVNSATEWLYGRLALILVGLLVLIGSFAVTRPISFIVVPADGWLAWTFMVVGTTASLYGGRYQAFLHGMNQVALHRRWEAAIHLAGLLATITAILLDGGLVAIVAVSQLILVIGVFINSRLCARFDEFGMASDRASAWRVVCSAWPAVWRSGIGITASLGAIQIVGLSYAQLAAPADVAALLLALRLAQVITLLSQPPFYAQIPRMARQWALGQRQIFLGIAQRGMRNSLFLVVFGFLTIGVFMPIALQVLGSDVQFVDQNIWVILSVAYFLERYGSMHIQLHSMNNEIVWHRANGISGLIFIASNFLLFPSFGILALPISLLVANAIFYVWFCAIKSFQLIRVPMLRFESRASVVPASIMLVFVTVWLITNG